MALFAKGINFYKAEKYRDAITQWNKVLAINPNDQKANDYIKRAKTKLILLGQ